MLRLITWPDGLWGFVDINPVSGPKARSSGGNTAQDGTEQTFEGIGDLVALELVFSAKNGVTGARRQRGLVTALHSGANAMRLQFNDPDIMTPAEAGVSCPEEQNWSNGEPWSNGEGWAPTYPVVPVAAAAGFDTGIVRLANEFWGHTLGYGDYLGFFPFHFGIYMVTEVIEPGQYRVWPRLRKALTAEDYATLYPTLVMKAVGTTVAPPRDLVATGGSITLVEVIDPYVRSDFTG
ncbi:hypothetical protein [Mesorhizobium xinjiangense]|uniref:hypothetical protein n=1 Tax=Mesorhizobium xinjiangense TaxID=2678685 RepID=UPI0012ED4ABF|nr:hypothetical protein [Mesorhizobium xinjiangense]